MSVYFARHDEIRGSGGELLFTEAVQRTKRHILDNELIIDRIITSPLRDARTAAEEISQVAASNVRISTDERWVDFDVDALTHWLRNGWHNKSPKPELNPRPLDKVLSTIASAYEEVARLSGTTLIVSNGEVYKLLQVYIQGLSVNDATSLKEVENGEITEIVKGGIDE